MMKVEKCEECNFKFHDIGKFSSRIRAKHHRRVKHTITCKICENKFISTTHRAVHKYLSHDIKCRICGIEKAGGEEMEIAHKELRNTIEVSEKVIMDSFSSASRRQIEILEESAWYIDVGNINCNSTNWAMLVYLPSPKVPMIGITEFAKRYIHDSMYMSALEKLKNYLNRLNHIGIIEHMNKYVEVCMKF